MKNNSERVHTVLPDNMEDRTNARHINCVTVSFVVEGGGFGLIPSQVNSRHGDVYHIKRNPLLRQPVLQGTKHANFAMGKKKKSVAVTQRHVN